MPAQGEPRAHAARRTQRPQLAQSAVIRKRILDIAESLAQIQEKYVRSNLIRCRFLAQSGPSVMSAVRSLSGEYRTWRGQPNSVESALHPLAEVRAGRGVASTAPSGRLLWQTVTPELRRTPWPIMKSSPQHQPGKRDRAKSQPTWLAASVAYLPCLPPRLHEFG